MTTCEPPPGPPAGNTNATKNVNANYSQYIRSLAPNLFRNKRRAP
ncbi:hypothetical protein BCEN4_700058 [Burkholderia cenocepacia]|nr:hypothetical protein BCEN4_700058 [Burkholderia cenocepacia]